MAFEQKIWNNEAEDGTIPEGSPSMSAEELNRIEQGIADSLRKDGGVMTGDLILNGDPIADNQAVNKGYVDNNILHFTGITNLKWGDSALSHNYFYLPEVIDLDRYEVFFTDNGLRDSVHPTSILQHLPKDETVCVSPGSSYRNTYLKIKLESSNKRVVFITDNDDGGLYSEPFDLFLFPTAPVFALTRYETET